MIRQIYHINHPEARQYVCELNQAWRNVATVGEKCGAKTRRGTPCQAAAMGNGRCPLHGGLARGPTSLQGKLRALQNLELGRGRKGSKG
ncbi:MAG TPA: HGGxSTG domain-containing protein [Candidatus Desulfobacillus sp.]|nr:HGGxSTG domain-containing protein [Candidatus Desulfobacillus sp.]